MISSMTGYGRGSGSAGGFSCSAELRSVNHRYADLHIRLPRELTFLEDRVRHLLLKSVRRGRIDAHLVLDEMPAGLRPLLVNEELASLYCQALRRLQDNLNLTGAVSLEHLLTLPDILKTTTPSLSEEQVWPAAAAALEAAMAQLTDHRRREGASLARDLRERTENLAAKVEKAALLAADAAPEVRKRIENRLAEYLGGQFEETRLLMECAILVERMGVDEELVRLRSHLTSFQGALNMGDAVGRKLDFLAQEMFREINTIGSKAGDYRLTELVVEMKAELEKIREQVQNLE